MMRGEVLREAAQSRFSNGARVAHTGVRHFGLSVIATPIMLRGDGALVNGVQARYRIVTVVSILVPSADS